MTVRFTATRFFLDYVLYLHGVHIRLPRRLLAVSKLATGEVALKMVASPITSAFMRGKTIACPPVPRAFVLNFSFACLGTGAGTMSGVGKVTAVGASVKG